MKDEDNEKKYYAGVDMTNWNLSYKEDDEKLIYKAFVAICNYAEEFIPCGKCPLYKLCFSENGEKFWNKIHKELELE